MINQFSTSFGIEPKNYIQRLKESKQIIDDFKSEEPSNFAYLITGIRGSGKTVLLSYVANYFKNDDDWIVLDSGPRKNMLENVAAELYEKGKSKHLFLKTEFNFSFHGASISISGGNPVSSLMAILQKMLEHIKSKRKKVLITVDEVDNSEDMKEFIQAYQSLIREGYPLMLLMTGLYENVSRLQNDKTLTFLYRAPKIYLGGLPLQSISFTYRKYINIDKELSDKMAALTKGYAYAYQVLGYLMYREDVKEINDELLLSYDQYLSEYVYEKVYAKLSKNEQKFINSLKGIGPTSVEEIRISTGFDTKILSVYRARLIKKGVIVPSNYAYVDFALPRFYEFLQNEKLFYKF